MTAAGNIPSSIPPILVECPRDAMQGWPKIITTDDKVRYLNSLLQVGFHTLDFGSFVSAKAIPQMADTREVVTRLDRTGSATRLLAIVANLRGAEEALAFADIDILGFPFSVSPTFQQRNTNSTMQESVERVEAIQALCVKHNRQLVVYMSMGFGNPYGDDYNADVLLHWVDQMVQRGIGIISLADTVGLATPAQVSAALQKVLPAYPGTEFGVHLHATAHTWRNKAAAAWQAGCTRFDGALKGIGGCPMAQDELVGNMDTLQLIDYFNDMHASPVLNREALRESIAIADAIFV